MWGEKTQTGGDDTEAQSDIGEGFHFKTSEETWNAEKETVINTLFEAEIEKKRNQHGGSEIHAVKSC